MTGDAVRAAHRPGGRRQRPAPPRLSWKPCAKARYYNVQFFRGKRKMLSAWPRRTRLQLRSAWRYGGRWQRLSARDLPLVRVAGLRRPHARRYGRVLGSRTFIDALRAREAGLHCPFERP